MLPWVARIACLIGALLAGSLVRADDLTDFNAAVETVSAHSRVAIGYLRTGNVDLASLEMDRLRDAWRDADGRPVLRADHFPISQLINGG